MTGAFAHPGWLLALLVPVLAAAAYVYVDRRRRRRSFAFGNFSIVAEVSGRDRPWLRHLPVAALLAALAVLAIALAGPMAETKVARNRATIMLVVDVSLSMSATDWDQSISEEEVKSWRGIRRHTCLGPFWVTFNAPSSAITNFVLIYFRIDSAS